MEWAHQDIVSVLSYFRLLDKRPVCASFPEQKSIVGQMRWEESRRSRTRSREKTETYSTLGMGFRCS